MLTLSLLSIIVFLCSLWYSWVSYIPCASLEPGQVSDFQQKNSTWQKVLAQTSPFLVVDFQTPHRKDIVVLGSVSGFPEAAFSWVAICSTYVEVQPWKLYCFFSPRILQRSHGSSSIKTNSTRSLSCFTSVELILCPVGYILRWSLCLF